MDDLEVVSNYDIVSPPSDTILRRISDLDIDLKMFRERIGYDVRKFSDLLNNQIKICDKSAYDFSQILGGSERFWKNRYNIFFEELDNSNKRIYSDYKKTLDELCESRNTDLSNLLSDFHYSTFEHLILDYFESPLILYSRTQRFEPSPVKIANWIRNCERFAEDLIFEGMVNIFSTDRLELAFPEIVSLSKVNNLNFSKEKLKDICYKLGIVLIFTSSKSGYGVSGFAKTILNNYRLVVITDRYKNNAAFWFTLLHELSHCLLHSLKNPLIHYSDNEFKLASLMDNNMFQEEEANSYVESLLFPDELKESLNECQSYKTIIKTAVKFDISASLLVAQIHRKKIAPYNWYRKVYRKVVFDDLIYPK